MRFVLSLMLAIVVTAGAAYAGCGKKVTDNGTLKSLDSDKKVIVIAAKDGKEAKLSLTAGTKTVGSDGKEAKLADFVGKKVTVISEHSKVDSVTLAKN